MNPLPLSNFSITNPDFKTSDVSTVLWKNVNIYTNINVELADTTFSPYDDTIQPLLEESWEILEKRAASDLPTGDKFKFYNSEILQWHSFTPETNTIVVQPGMFYKDITAARSQQTVYDTIPESARPSAFVLMNILITNDNQIVLGKRQYYGDWPHDTHECPGSFLKSEHIANSSLADLAKSRVYDDYKNKPPLSPTPLLICDLPRVMETLLLYVTHVDLPATALESDCYTDILTIENTPAGHSKLRAIPLQQIHPPSRVALELYFENTLS